MRESSPASEGRRGSALVVAVLAMMVLSLLAAALYAVFQMNLASYEFQREELQAIYSAEAGANLAVYMVVGGADMPQGDRAMRFLPDTSSSDQWFDLPGDDLGEVMVYVDPSRYNSQVSDYNGYEIRALGRMFSTDEVYTYGMGVAVAPENFARFSCFLNSPNIDGWYDDGYIFNGPFHANGPVCVYSSSPGSDNDPYFYSFNIARQSGGSGYYIYSEGGSGPHVTEPTYSNLTIQPDERMTLGPPYFDVNADSIGFGEDEVAWSGAREAAISGGLYFGSGGQAPIPSGGKLLVSGDTLWVKRTATSPVFIHDLGDLDNPVVWIDNQAEDNVYIKSYPGGQGLDMPLTIGMIGDLCIMGDLFYENEDPLDENNTDMLGLITVRGDFLIPMDSSSWSPPWTVDVYGGDTRFDATVMALEGLFQMESAFSTTLPNPPDTVTVFGGYIVESEGTTVWVSGGQQYGWMSNITYDTRLMTMHPPYFPQTQEWNVIYWEEMPDLTVAMIDDNLY